MRNPLNPVATFEIHYHRFLDDQGKPWIENLPPFANDPGQMTDMYRLMVLTRVFDTKAIAMQRTGQLGTYPSCLGQEAIGAAVGTAMDPSDVLVPSYREQAAQIGRGVTPAELLLFWGGDERGSDYGGPREDFPVCVPIATQCCHAVGVASAFKLRGESRAAVSLCGDGATSKGDFYEAMNLAGVWRLPVVFLVANNQWAISVPRSAQSAAETLAQKAFAAGFDGLQVDGNDVVAVRWAMDNALRKARDGGGPTLIEALTYRMQDHTTADDASRYRADEEVRKQREQDPVDRVRRYLTEAHGWSDDDETKLLASCDSEVQEAVAAYLATPADGPAAMFDYLYEHVPGALHAQRQAALEEGDGDA